jgi:hypothetical protein
MEKNKLEELRDIQEFCINTINHLSKMMEQLVRLQQSIGDMIMDEALDKKKYVKIADEVEQETEDIIYDMDCKDGKNLLLKKTDATKNEEVEELPLPEPPEPEDKPKKKGLLEKLKGEKKEKKQDKSKELIADLEKELEELRKLR